MTNFGNNLGPSGGSGAIGRGLKTSERVARQIVVDIASRGFVPGDSLPTEAEMLERYGVGRASLREALRILEVQGLVTIRTGPGGGPILSGANARAFGHMATLHFQFAKATFQELVDARSYLEPVLAARAAERRDPGAIKRLYEIVELESSTPTATDEYLELGCAFHHQVIDAAGNQVLALYARSLAEIVEERVTFAIRPFEEVNKQHGDHIAIADAIAGGDGVKAAALLGQHLAHFASYINSRQPGFLDEVIDWV